MGFGLIRAARLSGQLGICERVCAQKPEKRVSEEIGILPVVEAKLEFIEVSGEMLRADLMVGTDDGPLEQAPNALDAVGVNVATDPFFLAVINRFVAGVFVCDSAICPPFVRHDARCLGSSFLTDEVVKGFPIVPLLDRQANLPAALDRAEHHRLVPPPTLPDMATMATDQRLIYFDRPLERDRVRFLHRLADAVAEIPSRLVTDAEGALKLIGRDAFPRLAHQVNRREPFRQGEMRVVEDASSGHAELVAA